MKTILLTFFSCATVFSIAQVAPPPAFTYQAIARNALGQTLDSQNIGIQFSILKGSTVGPIQYQENQFTATNQFGLFTLTIGGGQVIQGNFSSIVWGNDAYYLKVGLDPTGGTNFQTMGITQFLSVPYAMYADSAGHSGQTYQILSFSHDTLYLSNGGNVYLGGYHDTMVFQNLAISSDTLGITHGNNVVLPTPTLSLNNDTLSISHGNSVVLPNSNVIVKFNGVPISDTSINYVMIGTNRFLTSKNYIFQLSGAISYDSYNFQDSTFLVPYSAGSNLVSLFAADSAHYVNNGPYYVGTNTLTLLSGSTLLGGSCLYWGESPGTIFSVGYPAIVYYTPLNPTLVILNNPYNGFCGPLTGTYACYQIYPNIPSVTGFSYGTTPIQVTYSRY